MPIIGILFTICNNNIYSLLYFWFNRKMKEANDSELLEQINTKIKESFKNDTVTNEDIEAFEKEMSSMQPGTESLNLTTLISSLKDTTLLFFI